VFAAVVACFSSEALLLAAFDWMPAAFLIADDCRPAPIRLPIELMPAPMKDVAI
jgi:hypothetical protein